jgi:hypothetical protein
MLIDIEQKTEINAKNQTISDTHKKNKLFVICQKRCVHAHYEMILKNKSDEKNDNEALSSKHPEKETGS